MVSAIGQQAQVAPMPGAPEKKSTEPPPRNGSSAVDGDTTEGGYRAKRYAVKYQPPCIFLEYEDTSKKRRVRAVKLNGVHANVDVDKLTRKVIRSFPRKIEPSSVKYDQVRKLVVTLVEYLAATEPSGGRNGGVAGGAGGGHGYGGRNGGPVGPSRLGPGGSTSSHDGGVSASAGRLSDSASGAGDAVGRGRLSDSAAGNSFSSPLPAMSPRVDSRAGLSAVARRLGGVHGVNGPGYPRGSVESSMSRFSTSTAGSSDEDDIGEDDREGGEDVDGDEEVEGAGGRGGAGGGGGGKGANSFLASALDDLDKEMAELGPAASTSGLSTRVNCSGGSSELVSSRDSSFSCRDRVPSQPPSFSQSQSFNAAAAPPPTPAGLGTAGGVGGKSRFAAEAAEKLTIGLEVTEDLDLNRVTEVELKMAKAVMEEDFKKNQLRPGDPGYVYDKQAEFGPPTENNDWDDDSDGEEEPSEEPEVDWHDIQAAVRKPTSVVVSVPAGTPVSTLPVPAAGGGGGGGGGKSPSPYNSNDWP